MLNLDTVYRFLDKLNNKLKDQVEQISFQHTKKILNNDLSIVFMTWLLYVLKPVMKMIWQDRLLKMEDLQT